eukprot:CAMPEP_0113523510 /NCGR_PEP_ID=MMETSP0014_2-20120614/45743_1 /TAXON_ID=2857 /ORGANISM="Nitzschia sp." /LENGTH=1702 /DNA_ID=CAMNT_0000421603 /DNA_START=271 /DNA_END=5379 /DNA_ORIENTATION=+ /assembly_acc=CAM_ASM_000159
MEDGIMQNQLDDERIVDDGEGLALDQSTTTTMAKTAGTVATTSATTTTAASATTTTTVEESTVKTAVSSTNNNEDHISTTPVHHQNFTDTETEESSSSEINPTEMTPESVKTTTSVTPAAASAVATAAALFHHDRLIDHHQHDSDVSSTFESSCALTAAANAACALEPTVPPRVKRRSGTNSTTKSNKRPAPSTSATTASQATDGPTSGSAAVAVSAGAISRSVPTATGLTILHSQSQSLPPPAPSSSSLPNFHPNTSATETTGASSTTNSMFDGSMTEDSSTSEVPAASGEMEEEAENDNLVVDQKQQQTPSSSITDNPVASSSLARPTGAQPTAREVTTEGVTSSLSINSTEHQREEDDGTTSQQPVPPPPDRPASLAPSSPRSAELASSEEESVAELGDVSEGECSSVEDFNDAETRRQRLEEEEVYRLNEASNQVEAMNIDSSGGVVAIAQQVSKKELKAPPKCARFSLPDDDTESLIDPQESLGGGASVSGDVMAIDHHLRFSPHSEDHNLHRDHHDEDSDLPRRLHSPLHHSLSAGLKHSRAASNASSSVNSTLASCGTEMKDNIAQLDVGAASPPLVATQKGDNELSATVPNIRGDSGSLPASSPEDHMARQQQSFAASPGEMDSKMPADLDMPKRIKWTSLNEQRSIPAEAAVLASSTMNSNSDSSQVAGPTFFRGGMMHSNSPSLGPGGRPSSPSFPFPKRLTSSGLASSTGGGSSINKETLANASGSISGCDQHRPTSLPTFKEPRACMWTSSHAANSPSEDRSSSLVNVLLQPLPDNLDSETQLPALETNEYPALVRLNLWSVIDGHGGGCVATYASEVLLPHIAATIARAMGCAIVSRGTCLVNGQLRDANALDLDGLIKTSKKSPANPNSIHYRSPYEASDSEDDEGSVDHDDDSTNRRRGEQSMLMVNDPKASSQRRERNTSKVSSSVEPPPSLAPSLLDRDAKGGENSSVPPSGSSVKTSVKTAASVANREAPVGTHSPSEVASITRAITESFLAVDEGWINSIDPVATHQTSCQSNGRWNSGACALVVVTIQRLEWTNVSEDHRERELRGPAKGRGHEGSQNKDAARRRMLDYATRAKSASSLSTISSTSSLTTTDDRVNVSGMESEITETEGEGDDQTSSEDGGDRRGRRNTLRRPNFASTLQKESLISPPGGCSCHCYRAYDALLYTAHVGDCRAVMLGSAPPRTIKVHGKTGSQPGNTTDDESSHHSSDETECLSSSDHDADSSDDEEIETERTNAPSAKASAPGAAAAGANSYMTYMRRPTRRSSRRRRSEDVGTNAPFIALPPLEAFRSVEIELEDEYERKRRRRHARRPAGSGHSASSSSSSSSSQDSREFPSAITLPPVTRPIDLTTDHSAYNPAEVTAVLRRCNNAPRAISAGVGGGIKRVAGSLAVTRALGDAYLKTPLLSFFPYKKHAPYITARPEVNCRPIVKEGDKVLLLATDGVWERASGEDVLRWVRTFYTERQAEAERRSKLGTLNKSTVDQQQQQHHTSSDEGSNSVGNGNTNSSNDKGDVSVSEAPGPDRDENMKEEPTQQGVNSMPSALASQQLQQQQLEKSIGLETKAEDAMMESKEDVAVSAGDKRDVSSTGGPPPASQGILKRRKIATGASRPSGTVPTRRATPFGSRRNSTVADVIVRRVLNKVRRTRNISSLHALMSLPPGRARRSKHDDITACVVDLSAFVS